uniref:Ubiquitin-fold modifier-conjugating enzyme 1 n=1 Tax=Rhizophora mucronata TaxID=61149 RepID=A0A2P2KK00_RHIMU
MVQMLPCFTFNSLQLNVEESELSLLGLSMLLI